MSAIYFVIENTIKDLVSKNQSFTAHDITLAIRQKGHQANHDEVKFEVHDYYDRGLLPTYKKTLCTFGSSKAYLYHLSSVDPSLYQSLFRQPQSPVISKDLVDSAITDPTVIQIPDFK